MSQAPTISVIEDDASVRAATSRLLTSYGYVVHAFVSADDFLLSPHVSDSACLIVDVQMPGMSGIELQAHLIAHGHCVPIIFVTAFPEDAIRARALKAGAACFLSKPFEGPRLIQSVEKALGRRNGH